MNYRVFIRGYILQGARIGLINKAIGGIVVYELLGDRVITQRTSQSDRCYGRGLPAYRSGARYFR